MVKAVILMLLGAFFLKSVELYGSTVTDLVLFQLGYIHPAGITINKTEDQATVETYGPLMNP